MFHKPCFRVVKRNHSVKNAFFGNGQAPDDLSPLPIEHPAARTPRSLTWYLVVVQTSYESGTDRGGQRLFKKIMFIIWIVQHFETTDLWNFTLLIKCKQVFFFLTAYAINLSNAIFSKIICLVLLHSVPLTFEFNQIKSYSRYLPKFFDSKFPLLFPRISFSFPLRCEWITILVTTVFISVDLVQRDGSVELWHLCGAFSLWRCIYCYYIRRCRTKRHPETSSDGYQQRH